jgi:hypothetical protein
MPYNSNVLVPIPKGPKGPDLIVAHFPENLFSKVQDTPGVFLSPFLPGEKSRDRNLIPHFENFLSDPLGRLKPPTFFLQGCLSKNLLLTFLVPEA